MSLIMRLRALSLMREVIVKKGIQVVKERTAHG